MPYLRPSKCLRSSESWKIKPVETMAFCLAMSSVPRVRMSCPRWSIHRFFAEDQTALGMPSLSSSSACHCKVSVAGQRMRVGPSPSETSAHVASESVLPRPTSSANNSRARSRGAQGRSSRCKLVAAAIDRHLGQRRRQLAGRDLADAHLNPPGDPPDLLDDGVGQRVSGVPPRGEFLLHPRTHAPTPPPPARGPPKRSRNCAQRRIWRSR